MNEKYCLLGCKKKNPADNVYYHHFPSNNTAKQKWIAACRLENIQIRSNMFICNSHFKQDDYLTGENIFFKYIF